MALVFQSVPGTKSTYCRCDTGDPDASMRVAHCFLGQYEHAPRKAVCIVMRRQILLHMHDASTQPHCCVATPDQDSSRSHVQSGKILKQEAGKTDTV